MVFNMGSRNPEQGLKLKWNSNDIYEVPNLITVEIASYDDIITLFHHGLKNKIVGSHRMNMNSSRSHTIFSVIVEQVHVSNPHNKILSKLQIVDLAGSERQSLTGNTDGKMQKESIEINKSLFTLRKVITALTTTNKSMPYIPYRDSKLTCLLRQSLGGSSATCMIACLQPSDHFFEENHMTLEYAAKAALISNRPVKNDDPNTKKINHLQLQVRMMGKELARANKHIENLSILNGTPVKRFGNDLLKGPQTSKKVDSIQLLPKIMKTNNIVIQEKGEKRKNKKSEVTNTTFQSGDEHIEQSLAIQSKL